MSYRHIVGKLDPYPDAELLPKSVQHPMLLLIATNAKEEGGTTPVLRFVALPLDALVSRPAFCHNGISGWTATSSSHRAKLERKHCSITRRHIVMHDTTRLKGVLAPVVTPFTADLSPDPERFITHCRWLLSQHVGLAVFGTNSEANSQSVSERMEL
ncbi:MAG TPA: hypothetical protein VLQ80_13085, partial [Candidatus Saccharimonadia bacterium]|nr:hypothetical protein [Candidatus Saccharimonadia bacterium]